MFIWLLFLKKHATFCIAAGGEIENRLTSGNDEKKYDDEINEIYFRKSLPPNQSW